jgi:hypothetical protein
MYAYVHALPYQQDGATAAADGLPNVGIYWQRFRPDAEDAGASYPATVLLNILQEMDRAALGPECLDRVNALASSLMEPISVDICAGTVGCCAQDRSRENATDHRTLHRIRAGSVGYRKLLSSPGLSRWRDRARTD